MDYAGKGCLLAGCVTGLACGQLSEVTSTIWISVKPCWYLHMNYVQTSSQAMVITLFSGEKENFKIFQMSSA